MQLKIQSIRDDDRQPLRMKIIMSPTTPSKHNPSTSFKRRQEYAIMKNPNLRPESASEVQKRLEYLQKKMESINLQESSTSLKSDEQPESRNDYPFTFVLKQKKRNASQSRSQSSPRRSERLASKDNRRCKNQILFSKKLKSKGTTEQIGSSSIQKQSSPITQNISKIKHKQSACTKSNTKSKVKPISLIDKFKKEAEIALNLSKKSCQSQYEKAHKKPKSIRSPGSRLQQMERELFRYKKQNQKLKGKLKLLQITQLDQKKQKNICLQKNQYVRKQHRGSSVKVVNASASKSMIRPTAIP